MPISSLHRATRPPQYCRQKEKGRPDRAYVWIQGKKVTLGRYGSAKSHAKYQELLASLSEQGPQAPSTDPTVSELIVAYLEFAKQYYRHTDSNPSREYTHIIEALKYLRREAGSSHARNFGPKRLKSVRQQLIDKGLSRVHINAQIRRIVCLFRWAVEEELVEETTHRALQAVRNLQRGRSKAKETAPVRPVEEQVILATLEELPQVVADMVRVQLLTGMRPGELCSLRPCDLDRNECAWLYTPEHHKTELHGHRRVVALGPQAQAVLLKYLARPAEEHCFQPRDSESKRLAAREAARVTPRSCGNRRGTNCSGTFKAGSRYSVKSYARAVSRAAKRAAVEHWTPQRLRHTKATDIRKLFGLDAAQAVLGHRGAKVTEVYAELDIAKAAEVAMKIG